MNIKKTILILLILIPAILPAQKTVVLTQNSKEQPGIINVKWYSQQFTYPGGVNIYRKEGQTSWEKINDKPVIMQDDMDEKYYRDDEDLQVFVELMKEAKAGDMNGFVLLYVMIKSFTSDAFSRFVGIQIDDSHVNPGETYQYKVMKIENGQEKQLAISEPVTAGEFKPLSPVQEIFVRSAEKKAELGWKIEEQRFYGVNIYRSAPGQDEKKLNDKPVMISMVKDSSGNRAYPEVKFIDDSLTEGSVFQYRLAGVDFFGNETGYSKPIEVVIKDVTPPLPPANVEREINKLQVTITWQNMEKDDLAGFNIYRSMHDRDDYEKINSILVPALSNRYIDKVDYPHGYYYYVAAVDKSGNEAKSHKMFAEVQDVFPPSVPGNVKAMADTGRIMVNWDKNTEPDLAGYLIFRKIKSNSKRFVLLNANPIADNFYIDSLSINIKNEFQYQVVAMDTSYNRSEFSEIAFATMPDVVPPAKPYIKSVTSKDEKLVIEWIRNVDTDLMGYDVYRSVKIDTTVTTEKVNANLLTATVNVFTDRWATPGTKYYYHLIARDSSGNQSARSEIFSGIIPVQGQASAVKISNYKVNYKSNKNHVELSWKVEAENLLGTMIFRKENETGTFKPLTGLLESEEYVDKEIRKQATYFYEIRGYDKSGSIAKSETRSVVVQ